MAPISRWCKDGRRLFLSFLGSFVNDSQPGGPGALEQITKEKKTVPVRRSLRSVLPHHGLQCSGGGHSRVQEPFWNTNQKAGWVMSQFFFQNACIRRGEQKDHQTQRLHWLELGNAISRRGNWGPHMNPTTMWLSKHAGTRQTKQLAGPEDLQGVRVVRVSGHAGQKLWHGPASVDDLGSSIRRVPCGEMGWKIRTRGRIRSPCRNEPGGKLGIDRACQSPTAGVRGLRVGGPVPGSCGETMAVNL